MAFSLPHSETLSEHLPPATPKRCSECWRAPAAVMVREVSPPELGATASALHLCVRGVVGSLGPLGIAFLTEHVSASGRREEAGEGVPVWAVAIC